MLLNVDPLVMGTLQGETPIDFAMKGGNLKVAHVLKGING